MSGKQWRPFVGECDECGGSRVEALTSYDRDNYADDGDSARCAECGRPGTVSVESEDEEGPPAWIVWHDEPECDCTWCLAMKYHEAEIARRVEQLYRRWAASLVPAYLEDRVGVATQCDEQLDPSGALLGYVREEAASARGDTPP